MIERAVRSGGALLFFLLAFALPATANAQAYQCRMPASIAVPQVRPDAPARQLPVTGYTLAISWSPEFCKGREGQARHRTQCSGRNGRFGFVVHGLWPESRGSWPQWCPTAGRLTPAETRRNMCMSPSAALLARQWAKHGSCMTRRPDTYFKVTRILWDSLRFPEMERLSREDELTAGRLRERFVAANKGWRADAVGLKLNRRGWLHEIRLCYDKRFRPTRCDAARYGAKDGAQLKIWRGL
ncbi:ribonuclease T [Erythrobacter sp. HKB08]|uniref:ribonuclease T2 family protein n=1 Tax=Erythrobacter sp. HKB08 TaxID=2502843 RepID=UPI001008CE54|nr:ribonuclease T [Erythrobacter sp. HKB08]